MQTPKCVKSSPKTKEEPKIKALLASTDLKKALLLSFILKRVK